MAIHSSNEIKFQQQNINPKIIVRSTNDFIKIISSHAKVKLLTFFALKNVL